MEKPRKEQHEPEFRLPYTSPSMVDYGRIVSLTRGAG